MLVNTLKEIKASASQNIIIEIEVQHPSSYFDLNFLGGMTNVKTLYLSLLLYFIILTIIITLKLLLHLLLLLLLLISLLIINKIYNNITNVVVKLSWKESSSKLNHNHALLINAHYDTIHGSPGASDDAVGVACMLETIRAISRGKKLLNPIIFLFNGAEESMMQVYLLY